MTKFSLTDIEGMDKRYRGAFINSLSGFKSLNLLGTINQDGLTNLAPFTQVFHIGASPALVGMIVRPDSVKRHSLENLQSTGFYTLNHVTKEFYKQAHQCSARYPDGVSEFDAVGLTEEYTEQLPAPYVKESVVKVGLEFAERHNLAINGTILVIGKIVEVIIPEEFLGNDGYLDVEGAGTVTVSSLDGYHITETLGRLPYAKPDSPLDL